MKRFKIIVNNISAIIPIIPVVLGLFWTTQGDIQMGFLTMIVGAVWMDMKLGVLGAELGVKETQLVVVKFERDLLQLIATAVGASEPKRGRGRPRKVQN